LLVFFATPASSDVCNSSFLAGPDMVYPFMFLSHTQKCNSRHKYFPRHPIVVIENVLNILSKEAMTYLIQEFYKLNYDFLAWRPVDLIGALPHNRNRVILVATRDGINPYYILFENASAEKKVRNGGEKNGKNDYLSSSSSSSAICALCQCSDDAPKIQDIAVICNTGQVNQAPSYHKIPCLLTSSASTYVCEFSRENSKKRKFEDGKDDDGSDDDDKDKKKSVSMLFPGYS